MQLLQESLDRALASDGRPVAAAVDALIEQAVSSRASDIHLDPSAERLEVRFRIDGVLQPAASLPRSVAENITARIKVMAGLVTYRTDIPQDGRITDGARRQDLRVSILPTLHGERAVIRLFGSLASGLGLGQLGFPEDVQARLREFIARPSGVFLLTGPSGSGKTATIYALLRELTFSADRLRNIITLEDPVEQDLAGVTQCPVHRASGFTFAAGLRAVVRQDPEVIVIGEIRDEETAQISIEAGLTGHLVISTLHSGTACGIFARLLDMGIEPYLLTSTLTGVMAQRLVRKLCPGCRRPMTMDDCVQGLSLPADSNPCEPGSCPACFGTGYSGRLPVAEVLLMSDEIRRLLLARRTQGDFEDCARRLGMVDLWARGLALLAAGETSLQELYRVIPRGELTRRESS